jgi:adenylate cyclase
MGQADEAVDLLRKARAANPGAWVNHLLLAAALGLRGDIAEAKAALAESIKLQPKLNSIAQISVLTNTHAMDNPRYLALHKKTQEVGLRRAGLPDE